MPTPTTRLAIDKAVAADNARDYLKTNLAAGLDIIDKQGGHPGWKGTDIASAAALTLGADANFFHVTGTTTITSISSRNAGELIALEFDGALTLTHNATTLILQGGLNVTTQVGDVVLLVSEGSGNWREVARLRGQLGVSVENRDVVEAEVVNTVTETTVFSYSVPGGTLGTTGVLWLVCTADFLNNSAAASDFTIRVTYGGTVIAAQYFASVPLGTGRRAILINVLLAAANATNAQRSIGQTALGGLGTAANPVPAGSTLDFAHRHTVNNGLAIDSTLAQALDVTFKHLTADAQISAKLLTAHLLKG